MSLKMRLFIVPTLFLVSFLLSIPALASTPKNLEPILAKLDADIQKFVNSKQIPGCAVAVVYQNKVVFMHSYGVKMLGTPEKINADTLFQLGSLSKPVAATLASVLEHKGYFKLDDPVNDYLPNFTLNGRQSPSTLKIKHILSHATGVPRAGFNNLIETHTPYDRILQRLQNTRVRTPIGKRYDYHNAMYSVISEITRSATHLPFKDALHHNLLEPLNMTNTSATLSGLLKTTNRATPHTRGCQGRLVPSDTYSRGYYSVAPAGGINSSVRDMATFLKAQMGGYPEVLNHKMLTRIQTPQIVTPNTLSPNQGPANLIKNAHYALGWRVVDFAHHKLVFHGGWVKGFTNFIGFIPEHQLGIVVLHNSESRFSAKTAVKFFESYFDIPRTKMRPLQKIKCLYTERKLARQAKKTKKTPVGTSKRPRKARPS
jgi:beta-lactamase class C